jgi:hypothetical protein
VEIVAFVEPSNDTEPETSPLREIVRAFSRVVAVEELPINGAVTAAN